MTNKTDKAIAEEELERIRRMAFTGTADNFLKLSDEDKKFIFAAGIRESTLRKRAEDHLAAYEQRIEELKGAIIEIMQEHEIPASDWIKGLLT